MIPETFLYPHLANRKGYDCLSLAETTQCPHAVYVNQRGMDKVATSGVSYYRPHYIYPLRVWYQRQKDIFLEKNNCRRLVGFEISGGLTFTILGRWRSGTLEMGT